MIKEPIEKAVEKPEAPDLGQTAESQATETAEKALETIPKPEEQVFEEEKAPAGIVSPLASAPPLTPQPKEEHLIAVEKILEEDLDDTFLNLPPETQQKFKIEGEKTALTIWQMVESAKVQIKRVIQLIRRWLKIIPGINRFFLEQETKIKTDKILELAKKHRVK